VLHWYSECVVSGGVLLLSEQCRVKLTAGRVKSQGCTGITKCTVINWISDNKLETKRYFSIWCLLFCLHHTVPVFNKNTCKTALQYTKWLARLQSTVDGLGWSSPRSASQTQKDDEDKDRNDDREDSFIKQLRREDGPHKEMISLDCHKHNVDCNCHRAWYHERTTAVSDWLVIATIVQQQSLSTSEYYSTLHHLQIITFSK